MSIARDWLYHALHRVRGALRGFCSLSDGLGPDEFAMAGQRQVSRPVHGRREQATKVQGQLQARDCNGGCTVGQNGLYGPLADGADCGAIGRSSGLLTTVHRAVSASHPSSRRRLGRLKEVRATYLARGSPTWVREAHARASTVRFHCILAQQLQGRHGSQNPRLFRQVQVRADLLDSPCSPSCSHGFL